MQVRVIIQPPVPDVPVVAPPQGGCENMTGRGRTMPSPVPWAATPQAQIMKAVSFVEEVPVQPGAAKMNNVLPQQQTTFNPFVPMSAVPLLMGAAGAGNSRTLGKLPRPRQWDPSDLGSMPAPRIWFCQVQDFCVLMEWNLPAIFGHFLTGEAVNWWFHISQSATGPMSIEDVYTRFMSMYTFTFQSEATMARHRLMNGEITLKLYGYVFHAFEMAFRACVREVGDMSSSEKIVWWLKGLPPSLAKPCAIQPTSNLEWTDLELLIKFTKGETIRLNVGNNLNPHAPNVNFFEATKANKKANKAASDPAAQPWVKTFTGFNSKLPVPPAAEAPWQGGHKQGGRGPSNAGRGSGPSTSGRGGGRGRGKQPYSGADGGGRGPKKAKMNHPAVNNVHAGEADDGAQEPMHGPWDDGPYLASIYQKEVEGYWHGINTTMLLPAQLRMRLDNWCPKCHRPGHVDVGPKGRAVCQQAKAAGSNDWPEGHYKEVGPSARAQAAVKRFLQK